MLQIGVLEDLLVELRCGVGVIHLSGGRGGEHILVVRVFAVLLDAGNSFYMLDLCAASCGVEKSAGRSESIFRWLALRIL